MKSQSDDRHFLSAEVTLSTPFVWTATNNKSGRIPFRKRGRSTCTRDKELARGQTGRRVFCGRLGSYRKRMRFRIIALCKNHLISSLVLHQGYPTILMYPQASPSSVQLSLRFLCIVVRLLCLPVLWLLYSLVLLLVDHVIELHLSSEIESKQVFHLSLCLTPLSMCSRFTSSGADQLLVSIFLQRGRIKVRSKTGLDVLYYVQQQQGNGTGFTERGLVNYGGRQGERHEEIKTL